MNFRPDVDIISKQKAPPTKKAPEDLGSVKMSLLEDILGQSLKHRAHIFTYNNNSTAANNPVSEQSYNPFSFKKAGTFGANSVDTLSYYNLLGKNGSSQKFSSRGVELPDKREARLTSKALQKHSDQKLQDPVLRKVTAARRSKSLEVKASSATETKVGPSLSKRNSITEIFLELSRVRPKISPFLNSRLLVAISPSVSPDRPVGPKEQKPARLQHLPNDGESPKPQTIPRPACASPAEKQPPIKSVTYDVSYDHPNNAKLRKEHSSRVARAAQNSFVSFEHHPSQRNLCEELSIDQEAKPPKQDGDLDRSLGPSVRSRPAEDERSSVDRNQAFSRGSEKALNLSCSGQHKLATKRQMSIADSMRSELDADGLNADRNKPGLFTSLSRQSSLHNAASKKGILINKDKPKQNQVGPMTVYEGALHSQRSIKNQHPLQTLGLDEPSNRSKVTFNMTPEVRLVSTYIRGKNDRETALCCKCTLI